MKKKKRQRRLLCTRQLHRYLVTVGFIYTASRREVQFKDSKTFRDALRCDVRSCFPCTGANRMLSTPPSVVWSRAHCMTGFSVFTSALVLHETAGIQFTSLPEAGRRSTLAVCDSRKKRRAGKMRTTASKKECQLKYRATRGAHDESSQRNTKPLFVIRLYYEPLRRMKTASDTVALSKSLFNVKARVGLNGGWSHAKPTTTLKSVFWHNVKDRICCSAVRRDSATALSTASFVLQKIFDLFSQRSTVRTCERLYRIMQMAEYAMCCVLLCVTWLVASKTNSPVHYLLGNNVSCLKSSQAEIHFFNEISVSVNRTILVARIIVVTYNQQWIIKITAHNFLHFMISAKISPCSKLIDCFFPELLRIFFQFVALHNFASISAGRHVTSPMTSTSTAHDTADSRFRLTTRV